MEGWRKLTGQPAAASKPAAAPAAESKAPAGPVGVQAATSATAPAATARGRRRSCCWRGRTSPPSAPPSETGRSSARSPWIPRTTKSSSGRTARAWPSTAPTAEPPPVHQARARRLPGSRGVPGGQELQLRRVFPGALRGSDPGQLGRQGAAQRRTAAGIDERWKDNKGYDGHAPARNVPKSPGEWQTFDVTFRPAPLRRGRQEGRQRVLREGGPQRRGGPRERGSDRPDAVGGVGRRKAPGPHHAPGSRWPGGLPQLLDRGPFRPGRWPPPLGAKSKGKNKY